jgi:ADP-ribosylglycohydrolase
MEEGINSRTEAFVGCLLGTAVGDAIGLPYEGLSPCRAAKLLGVPDRHRFFRGRGMVSDDTEHACFVAEALIDALGDPEIFERRLVRSLRWWLLGLPAGIGFATLRAILKLWIGFPPSRSGVFSAGNGPAMRAGLLGVAYGHDPTQLEELVRRSTRITHSDPRAYRGALTVALAAHGSARGEGVTAGGFVESLSRCLPDSGDELLGRVAQAAASAERGEPLSQFAEAIGCAGGISGYVLHTVPAVIQTWLRHQEDYAGGIRELVAAGGDTDTTAAILGGILGSRMGVKGIPRDWIEGVSEWPRTTEWMAALAEACATSLGERSRASIPRLPWNATFVRNLGFLTIVLAHGVRRLAPPYS